MSHRAAIFDMDGVLVDSYEAHFRSWHEALGRHGLSMSRQDFSATFGRTSREIIRQLFPGEFDAEAHDRLDAEKEAAYREILAAEVPAMDGAPALLRALAAAGWRLAIGSSGPPENVRVVLENLPGADAIEAAVDGRQVTRGKPHPEVFRKAAEKLGIPPGGCAVIEDAPAGIRAARAAGMAAVALTGTADRKTLEQAGAHLVVDSLRELSPEALATLLDEAARAPIDD